MTPRLRLSATAVGGVLGIVAADAALARSRRPVPLARVKGMTLMVTGIYNGSRYEDLWLDR